MNPPIGFDQTPLTWLALGLLGWLGVLGGAGLRRRSAGLWPAAVLGLLGWLRLPVVLFNRELNADESQVISHAITLAVDPVFWRSVDGTTIGPLDIYALLLPRLAGLPFDYTAARLVGLLCIGGAWLFLYLALRNRTQSPQTARLASLPAAAVLLFTQHPDLVHYSSEHLPVLLLALALWTSTLPRLNDGLRYLLVGLLLGMVPFAKLQGVPLAGAIGLALALPLIRDRAGYLLGALVLGGLLFPVLVFAWAASYGVFGDVIDFYIRGNLVYQTNATLAESFQSLWRTLLTLPELLGALLFGLLLAGLALRRPAARTNLGVLALLTLAASLFSILKTGNAFGHYLLWLLIPLTLVCGWALHRLANGGGGVPRATVLMVLAAGLLLPVGLLAGRYQRTGAVNAYPSTPAQNRTLARSPLSEAIARYARGTDRLVVWGWACRFYVETGLAQGTAENHSERCIYDHPLRELYRRRYLADMMLNQPMVFVDAVGPASLWLQDVRAHGHGVFPELKLYVSQEYVYAGTVESCRLYVRRDRFDRANRADAAENSR
jgi:hypothetical protein